MRRAASVRESQEPSLEFINSSRHGSAGHKSTARSSEQMLTLYPQRKKRAAARNAGLARQKMKLDLRENCGWRHVRTSSMRRRRRILLTRTPVSTATTSHNNHYTMRSLDNVCRKTHVHIQFTVCMGNFPPPAPRRAQVTQVQRDAQRMY